VTEDTSGRSNLRGPTSTPKAARFFHADRAIVWRVSSVAQRGKENPCTDVRARGKFYIALKGGRVMLDFTPQNFRQVPASSPVLQAALHYATRLGWKVFPARMEGGKKYSFMSAKHAPGGENWGMTNDPVQVRKNFTRKQWCAVCGVGIPTGAVNGIFVVECDTKAGHANLAQDGAQLLAALEEQHGKLPDTLMAQSPSGSVHRYFKHPGRKVRSSSSSIAVGVDVKGDGGMVIAPPSQRHDGSYRWLNWETPIAEGPAWLLELVSEKREQRERNVWQKFGQQSEVDIDRLMLALALVPNDDLGWDDWNSVALAIWHATNGSAEGLDLFAAWSAKSMKCGGKESSADTWERITNCPPKEIGAGTIFYLANEAFPNWSSRLDDEDVSAKIEAFAELLEQWS
jgi:Bifunctional DNA primase/polymerase, N-terminal/Primase C terminal 2 (PriCT-2)